MSNINLIIEERPADIGNFLVGRLLPFRGKRMVGPFIFIDHMGPAELGPGQTLNIGPHPHIGLSTLTYLFEGEILHRDSLGTEVEIQPGAVNLMTAGKGIVHSERTPARLVSATKRMHGLQIWLAMPKDLEQSEPSFSHTEAQDLPAWTEGAVQFKLIAGEALGYKSPVPVLSRLFLIEISASTTQAVQLGDTLFGEVGIYTLCGSLQNEGNIYAPKHLLVAKDSSLCEFTLTAGSTIYVFGGEPFPEERHIFWNFVSTDKALIEQAKANWQAQRMGTIPGETDIIPLPQVPSSLRPKD